MVKALLLLSILATGSTPADRYFNCYFRNREAQAEIKRPILEIIKRISRDPLLLTIIVSKDLNWQINNYVPEHQLQAMENRLRTYRNKCGMDMRKYLTGYATGECTASDYSIITNVDKKVTAYYAWAGSNMVRW